MSYTYSKVSDLEGTEMVGNHLCVALVRKFAGAPATLAWKQGAAVLGNNSLKKGTAIATFVNGKYPNKNSGNHAAFYMGQTSGGIIIMDQWKNKKNNHITSRKIPSKGKTKNGAYVRPSDNADAFFVIE